MSSRKKCTLILCLVFSIATNIAAQSNRPPAGGRLAVVVDERLAALRERPSLNARLVRRLSRGRLVAMPRSGVSREGIVFYRVRVTRRTVGWIQRESLVNLTKLGEDVRLRDLVLASTEFDRLVRARLFLNWFRKSRLRPEVLLIYAQAADQAAAKLTREARDRLGPAERIGGDAPEFSYYLNYRGLDRYNRQGVGFVFERTGKRLLYDGAAWRELVQRYPQSREASEARKRLAALPRM